MATLDKITCFIICNLMSDSRGYTSVCYGVTASQTISRVHDASNDQLIDMAYRTSTSVRYDHLFYEGWPPRDELCCLGYVCSCVPRVAGYVFSIQDSTDNLSTCGPE